MPNKGYVLSTRDRMILNDLIRKWEQERNGRRGINPNQQNPTPPIWCRVKTGTRITALREIGGTLEPGAGEAVLWRNGWVLNGGVPDPVLTKINSVGSTEGQDTANEADDETITVWNFTPFELFECTWFQATLSRQGKWEVSNPPLPVYFARAQEVVVAGQIGTFELGHLPYDVVATGTAPSIQWITGVVQNVLCALNSVDQNEIVIVAQEPGGKFVVVEQSSSSTERVRFALDAPFNNVGEATATVLDAMNSESVVANDVITVYDIKKQFGDTRAYSVGFASRFVIGDGTGTPSGSIWHVETSDQVVNKFKGLIVTSLDGNDPTETVSVDITNDTSTKTGPESVWPYVLDPAVIEGNVTATNLNMFTANAGEVWIERRVSNSLLQQSSNTSAPYSHTGGGEYWVITEVAKPTARWAMCKWVSPNWQLSVADGFWEGYSPAAHDTLSAAVITTFLPPPCELDDQEKAIAFLNNRGMGDSGPNYVVISTLSALYGEGKQVDLVADLLEDPTTADNIVYEDACDLKYRKVSKAIVFGSTLRGDCLMEATDETALALDQDTLEVVTSITKVVDSATGEIKLELQKSSIKTCLETPLAQVDVSILTPVMSTLLTDIACVGSAVTKSYETIKHLGTTVTGSTAVDLSCVVNDIDWGDVYIDYNNVVNWPDVYVDYYHILWPSGCEPCDPPPDEGCCTITYSNGSTEDRSSSSAWCTAKGTEEGITSTAWASGGPCGDETGCCIESDGTVTAGSTEADCDSRGGAYQGDGTTCPDVGCCTEGGVEYSDVTNDWCTEQGGSWVSGDCGCTPAGCCCGDISNFQIYNFTDSSGYCSGSASQTGGGVGDGSCSWTVNVDWSFSDGSSGSGTVTVTWNGSSYAFTGSVPGGGTVSGTGASGSNTASGISKSGCDSTWTGDHDFTNSETCP